MSKNNQTDPRKGFVPLILPWVLGAVMLGVYGASLNHWITMLNLMPVAQVSGFIWQPQLYHPLTYLATLPFHWLSPANIPVALNLFSAVCAALTLVMLARCVAILPQDRTELQRQREKSDFSFLTGWQSYFPPVLAVLLMGLQITFWEHATSFTGEMTGLLVFAFIVWQVLEYRLDEKERRLTLVMIAYGAGLTESWAFLGFFPILLAAIIWLKKLDFFSVRFLTRMILLTLAGMLFFLILPAVAKCDPHFKLGLWQGMRSNIRPNWDLILSLQQSDVRIILAQASLSSLLPLLLIAIRWTSGYGDSSRIGAVLANNMVHVVHAAVFGLCVWVMFDPPFSPHQLFASCQHPLLYGAPCLTLDLFCALSIGYCCAYFLLVFTRKPKATRRDSKPLPVFPQALMWLCPVIATGVFACSLIVLGALIYQNRPVIKDVNSDVLLKFAQFTTENLPKNGAIILCDSDTPGQDQPLRALLVQAAIAREGRTKDFPVLDTFSLNWVAYHQIVHADYPHTIPLIVTATNSAAVNPMSLFGLLISLSKSNAICYLHPSYGYYFEQFYQEPHGMAYLMKPLSEETLLPAPLDKNLIVENEAFWDKVVSALDDPVQKALAGPDPYHSKNAAINYLLEHLHPVREANENAIIAGMLCSRCLDDWGVQLQRAGELEKAARRFDDAKRFNPDNVVADINLEFNKKLRTGAPIAIDLARVNADEFGKYRNWNAVVTANGPFDEISYNFAAGNSDFENRFSRQAAAQFTRVRQLAPDNLFARLQLARIYLASRLPDRALEAIHDPLTRPAAFGLNETNSTGLAILAASAHFQKNEVAEGNRLMEIEVARHPDDNLLLAAVTQAYFNRGLYTNALRIIDGKLARTPDDAAWQFDKGYVSLQLGAYDEAVKAMTKVLQIQTNNDNARFDRAIAYLKGNMLDEARADYRTLQTTYTNAFPIAYGLGEIAWRKHENGEAIRNYRIYTANAPTNAPELPVVRERLTQLRGQ